MTATVEYLETELVRMGYEVERHVFPVGGKDCINLIVELPGSSHPDEIVVVGGHYDTCGPIPGANDNGTGTAATLVLAKHYADKEPARTLRFALFVNEEPPFFRSDEMGSRQYAKRCAEREEDITGMLSLETMGYYSDEKGSQKYPSIMRWFYPGEGNFIGFVGNVSSRKMVRRAVKVFRENAEFPSEGAALPSHIPGVGWSDHESFWLEGYSAVMVTDTAPFRYPHYHKSTDTPDKCDFARLARVVEGLVHVVDDLVTPKD
jgi:Zn-dependent M28 family amino/carboxypeptidase